MTNQNSADLKLNIDELDRLLIDGYNIYQRMYVDYAGLSTVGGFDLDSYFESASVDYQKWNVRCGEIINRLPRLHYIYHFIQPKKPAGVHIEALPDLLSRYKIHLQYQLVALEEIIISLEEKESLALRREIADKEYSADVMYKITYSQHKREIKLNNIVLHKSNFDSENDNFFEYVFVNSGRPIPKVELVKANGAEFTKRLDHCVRDLGFVGDVADIFFPVKTKNEVMFVNPISKQYAMKNDLPTLNFKKIGRASKVL